MKRPRLWMPFGCSSAALVAACIAVPEGEGTPKLVPSIDDGGVDALIWVDASQGPIDATSELPPGDPHQLLGISPDHGPFSGGVRALIQGRGFGPQARAWVGPNEVPDTDLVLIDSSRLQISVPAGDPGNASIRVQQGDDTSTLRTLADAYHYDAFYAEPSTGPTSGGVVVQVTGKGTSWDASTTVQVGGTPCSSIAIQSPTLLRCTTPAHPAGSVPIAIQTSNQPPVQVDDAFVYADSTNGFKGGLSGLPLQGLLTVVALNSYTGLPIGHALVVAGDSLATGLQQKTDPSSGTALFSDPSLSGTRSVSVAAKCFSPVTFVDVPVDRVTAYLTPIQSPECADGGEVPPVGGHGTTSGRIEGQLVWTGGNEFKRAPWSNIPAPGSSQEKQAAYLFTPGSDPTADFWLPDASQAVHPEADGTIGYDFAVDEYPGNTTLYAIAGIEDRSVYPPKFTGYAFGMARGIIVSPGVITRDVYIQMNTPLDHAVSMHVTPPVAGTKGPDRVRASVAVQLGLYSYAVLPNLPRTVPIASTLDLSLVGLPALDSNLSGARYISSASAVTGASALPPLSVVGQYASIDSSLLIDIAGFVPVPALVQPPAATAFDGQHLQVSHAPGSVDLSVIQINGAQGLVQWTVVVPGDKGAVQLPDLGSLGMGVPHGSLDILVYLARIDGFDYGSLAYRNMTNSGWSAYAHDAFHAFY